ncbi:MAG: alkylphosphonate utilization protein [Paracoccus sp. (in: a-proteobacteria)]|nr:alkylphosphonate utilization protein [Paracoccus sp. (in: a-proteobacteria)]
MLPPIRLVGADLLRGGEIRQRSVAIAQGRITKGPLPAADFSGHLILPGIIDLFAEYRPGPDPATGIAKAGLAAARAGITTQWLAQGYSWEGGARSPLAARGFLEALANAPSGRCDIRAKIVADTHLVEDDGALIDLLREYRVGAVSFANMAARVIEMARNHPAELRARAQATATTPEALAQAAACAAGRARDVPRHLCRLADAFDMMGVIYASHGDPNAERREFHSMLGARIAECPACHGAAAAARAMGNPVLAAACPPAPGLPSTLDLVAAGLVDALVSGASPAALPAAAFDLVARDMLDLPAAWALISQKPAEIMELADRGTLDYGMRADLVVISKATLRVEATISAGRLTHATPGALARIGAAAPQKHAASRRKPVIAAQ